MTFHQERYDSFDPETLELLVISFHQAWAELQHNGNSFDQAATRAAIADLIILFASQGETDPKKIKSMVLEGLAPREMERERRAG
jgi:hypothetical protein